MLAFACAQVRAPVYTGAEIDAALAPARDLWGRCYAGSELARAGSLVTLEYRLNIDPRGEVRSVPTWVKPESPRLIECVRLRLDRLRFAPRAKDHLNVHFELGPTGTKASLEPAPVRASGTCRPACTDGFSCRYEPGSPRGVCRVQVGRCRFDADCAVLQGCQRSAEPLGVCVERP